MPKAMRWPAFMPVGSSGCYLLGKPGGEIAVEICLRAEDTESLKKVDEF